MLRCPGGGCAGEDVRVVRCKRPGCAGRGSCRSVLRAPSWSEEAFPDGMAGRAGGVHPLRPHGSPERCRVLSGVVPRLQ